MTFTRTALFTVCVAASFSASTARAQDTTQKSIEDAAARARRGAGLAVGSWSLVDDPATGSSTSSQTPIVEGYFRKGLDKHLALESSIAVFRRKITTPPSGGLGGSPGGSTSAIVIPQMYSLKLFPVTNPDQRFEPFISGGAGIVLGFESTSGGGSLLGGGSGSTLLTGIGGLTTAGFEWRFSRAFGLTAGAHYIYLQFFDELAGAKLYRGLGARGGLTYRFQY